MEAGRRTRSSLRRKPLSDCTNTFTPRNPSAIPKPPSNSSLSKTNLHNISKPKKTTTTTRTTSDSLKSNTSTGSNVSPNNTPTSVPSQPPAPSTPPSDSDRRKSGFVAAQSQMRDAIPGKDKQKIVAETPVIQTTKLVAPQSRQVLPSAAGGESHPSKRPAVQGERSDARTRKDKGKMVLESPIIKITKQLAPEELQVPSSVARGNCHPFRPPAVQSQKPDAQIHKDKGKMVIETPIIEITEPLAPQMLQGSSSAASNNHLPSIPHVDRSQRPDTQARKDKGKMVIETPIIEITDPLAPQLLQGSSSAASNNHLPSRPHADRSQRPDTQTRKDKGKMVIETPIIEITESVAPQILQGSPSAAWNNWLPSRPHADQSQRPDTQARKDKGKMVIETPIIEITDPLAPQVLQVSSSTALDNCHPISPPAVQGPKLDAQTRKDKGKLVLETPVIPVSKSLVPQMLKESSSAAICDRRPSRPPAVQSRNPDAQTSKDKGKLILEYPIVETSEPVTPHAAPLVSSSSASGTHVQERPDFLTVYNQRRSSQRRRRNSNDGKILLPLSCPPEKRVKKKGVEFNNDASDKPSGSRTDPLPLNKKRPRNKHDASMHAMPQDEIDRLRSYYADIDAFELPEEVASESDLD